MHNYNGRSLASDVTNEPSYHM